MNNFLLAVIITVVFTITLTVASKAASTSHNMKHDMKSDMKGDLPTPPAMKSRKPISKETKDGIIAVLKRNELLHASFFKYDPKQIKVNAEAMIAAIDKIKDKEISIKLSVSRDKLSKLGDSMSKKENNEAYNLISLALIHIITSYDVGNDYNGYFCPMEKKKWVQNTSSSKEVSNPYASEMMPRCGEMVTNY